MVTTNNIIDSNVVDAIGGQGGGIYTLDFDAQFDPTIEHNDLWNNAKNQIAGDRTDGDTIGVDGNFSADPLYVDAPTGDYHLDPNSPAIDTGPPWPRWSAPCRNRSSSPVAAQRQTTWYWLACQRPLL